jgi:hypothetical protein
MLRFKSKFASRSGNLEIKLTLFCRKKYSVAETDKVSVDVARKWTDELFAMLEEMVPEVTKS